MPGFRGQPRQLGVLEQVRTEVDDHPALASTLQRALEEQKAQVERILLGGSCKTFEEYRYQCGKIEGLDIAIATCKHVQSRLSA